MPTISTQLIEAYRAALYRVETPSGELALRIDQHDPGIDPLLASFGVHRAVLLTAWNPRSRPYPEAVNQRRGARLEACANQHRRPFLPAAGAAADGCWCEKGLLLLGVGHARACQLAARFGQAGFVELQRGERPSLFLHRCGCSYRRATVWRRPARP